MILAGMGGCSMASYPGRNHTKRGYADARGTTLCNGQPDADCPCKACVRWVEVVNRQTTPPERPAYGDGE